MAELSPALAAALRGERPLLVGIVEINLPGYDLLLIDGAAELMIGNRKFVGRDPVYGVLDTVKGLSDAIGDQAPAVSLGLIPATDTSLAKLLDPAVQGSSTTISIGAVNPWTGQLIDSYVLTPGTLDVPTVTWEANDRRLEYKITGIFDRLFATEEGIRLSDAFHQAVWPNELGLAFVTDVETIVDWGMKVDNTVIYTRTNIPSMGVSTSGRT